MDRELVEKITKLVIEELDNRNKTVSVSNQDSVKIWPHESPLPDPIELTRVKPTESTNSEKLVRIKPYK